MPIIPFNNNISDIKAFGNDVAKVMAFGEEVYTKQSSIPDYLCFTALEAGTFTLTVPAAVTATDWAYVEYSTDGKNWTKTNNSSSDVTITTPSVAAGGKVYWRGSGRRTAASAAEANASKFSSSASFDVSGHITSLLNGDDSDNMSNASNCTFCFLFKDSLVANAARLVLPSALASTHTYTFYNMFAYCASLITSAPINATRLPSYSCTNMYRGCTSLSTTPSMSSVTTVDSYCCRYMFLGCTQITSLTMPSAITLTQSCYEGICQDCTNVSYVKCLATDISATNCLQNWLLRVSSTGTFIQAAGVTWPRGASGIPTGWLAYDEGEEIPNDYTACDYILNTGSASAAAVAIGTTSGINEPFEVDFPATEIVASDRTIAGYNASDTSVTPKQGSQSYFYLRTNPDSFQHQIYRLNTSGDTLASTNGLLKNGRDLDRHTAKVTYPYHEKTGFYTRNLYFDGVLISSHSTVIHPTPLIGTGFYVFGFSSSSSRFINGKIYGLRWWEEDEVTLKANLIPCSRNSDGAAGFWDTAQKQFFTSTYWTAHFDNE